MMRYFDEKSYGLFFEAKNLSVIEIWILTNGQTDGHITHDTLLIAGRRQVASHEPAGLKKPVG
jgi:hypothetical protein